MATFTKVFGWLEVGIAVFAAYICGKGIFYIVTPRPGEMMLEWVPLVIALSLPTSLSLGWAGWHLIRRQDWLHQAAPFFVVLANAAFMFAIDY